MPRSLAETGYGQGESVAELVPFMLEAFLEFVKARKDGELDGAMATSPPRRGRPQVETPAAPFSSSKEA